MIDLQLTIVSKRPTRVNKKRNSRGETCLFARSGVRTLHQELLAVLCGAQYPRGEVAYAT